MIGSMSKAVSGQKRRERMNWGGGVSWPPSCAQIGIGPTRSWGGTLSCRTFFFVIYLSCVYGHCLCVFRIRKRKKEKQPVATIQSQHWVHEQGLKTGWFSMSWQKSPSCFFLGGGISLAHPLQKGEGLQYVSLVTVAPRLRRPKKEMCLGLVFLNSAQKDGECCSRGPQLFLVGGQ